MALKSEDNTGGGRRTPCRNCPWRLDSDPRRIPRFDMDRARGLAAACPDPSSLLGPPLMACHESPEGDDSVCLGWATSDASRDSIPLRLAMSSGLVPIWRDLEEARSAAGIELHSSHADMIAGLEALWVEGS